MNYDPEIDNTFDSLGVFEHRVADMALCILQMSDLSTRLPRQCNVVCIMEAR